MVHSDAIDIPEEKVVSTDGGGHNVKEVSPGKGKAGSGLNSEENID